MSKLGLGSVLVWLLATLAAGEPKAEELDRIGFADAIKRALAANPSARAADVEIHRAQALVEQARATSLPTLTGILAYERLDHTRVFANTVVAPANSFNASALLSVPLVNAPGWVQWSHARKEVDLAKASTADVKRQLALETGRAYLAIIVQKRLLETSLRARDSAKAHFDFARDRERGGVGNKVDVARAAQELATSESAATNSEIGVMRAREALGVLVGADHPVDNSDETLPGGLPSLDEALADSERHRADVLANRQRVRVSEYRLRNNWVDLLPTVSGAFQPFYQDPPTFNDPATGWQAEVVLTVPFYDGGLRYGQWKERRATALQARLGLEASVRQAASEVRTAHAAIGMAEVALSSAREAATQARQALTFATINYRGGTSTNIEVIDAERRARDAETQAAIAEDVVRNAQLDLLSASGRLP